MDPEEEFSIDPNDDFSLGLNQLQYKYVIPFAVGVFLAILIVGLIFTARSRSIILDKVEAEQQASAKAGSRAVTANIETTTRLAEDLSVAAPLKNGDYTSAAAMFKSRIEYYHLISSVFFFNPSARTIISTDKSEAMAGDILKDQCFSKAKSGTSSCVSGLYKTEEGGRRAFIFKPVFSARGSLSGVLAVGLNLEDKGLISVITSISPGKGGFSYLVDQDGKLIINGDPDKNAAIQDVSKAKPVTEVLSGRVGSINYDYSGKNMFASFCPVEGAGWGFVTQRPQGEATEGIGTLIGMLIFFLIIGSGGAFALALVQAQTITRFLFILNNRMESLAGGRRTIEIPPEDAQGLDQLAELFNRMINAVEGSREQEEQKIENIRKTEKFKDEILLSIRDMFLVCNSRLEVVFINSKAETFLAEEIRPAPGKSLFLLGDEAWARRELDEAARRAINTGETIAVNGVRFQLPGSSASSVFDFRVYPIGKNRDGAIFYGREVTEVISLHEQVQSAERFFREAIENAPEALVVIDSELKIEWFNPCAKDFLGLKKDSIGDNWTHYVAEKQRGAMGDYIRKACNTLVAQGPNEIELEWGNIKFSADVTVGPIPADGETPGAVISFRRIPSYRRRDRDAFQGREKLENKIRFLTSVIDAAPEPLALAATDGRILMVNPDFAALFKERKEVFIGKKLDSINADNGPLIDCSIIDRDGAVQFEARIKNMKGEIFLATVKGALVGSGAQSGYLFSFREIESERRSRMKENRALESRIKTRMARDIADRFITIIDKLGAAIMDLGQNIFADELRSQWHKILIYCKDLTHASNALSIYATEMSFTLAACNIETVINEVATEINRKKLIPARVKIEISIQENCPVLNADADQLKMAVWHIIKNAAEAAGKNPSGGRVIVRAMEANVEETSVLLVEILDNGVKFNSAEVDRFFEPFYGESPGGLGLGLTLSRRAILKHQGHITIQRSGAYTSVSFYIPFNLTPAKISKSSGQIKQKT